MVGECVVNNAGDGALEIKNIAVDPSRQHQGYGRMLIDFVAKRHAGEYDILQVGTGDSPLTVPFYERCGFERSHVVEGFFTENYDHPIFEGSVQLVDMIYLAQALVDESHEFVVRGSFAYPFAPVLIQPGAFTMMPKTTP